MADRPARTELDRPRYGERHHAEHGGGAAEQPAVTTGPIRGSRKIHVEGRDGVRVAMREIDLEPGSGEPPLRVYDTSGP